MLILILFENTYTISVITPGNLIHALFGNYKQPKKPPKTSFTLNLVLYFLLKKDIIWQGYLHAIITYRLNVKNCCIFLQKISFQKT